MSQMHHHHHHRRPWIILIIGIVLLAFLLGVWVQHNTKQTKNMNVQAATVLTNPRQIESFTLVDDNGKPFTKQNLIGHWSLLFFGFTRCPDLCPTTLSMLNQAYNIMQHDRLNPMPQVVFISVDPEHDAVEGVIKRYLTSFNSAFIGATGEKEQLDQLTQNLSVLYMKVMNSDNEHYMIDHSGTVLLINPQGDLAAIFSAPHQAATVAADVSKIIQQANKAS